MVPYTSLSNKVSEIYSDFIKHYPTCQYREDILELTINRILRRLADMSQETLNCYFIGQQLRVDVTIELTKIAMSIQSKPDFNSIPWERVAVLYNQYGKKVYSTGDHKYGSSNK